MLMIMIIIIYIYIHMICVFAIAVSQSMPAIAESLLELPPDGLKNTSTIELSNCKAKLNYFLTHLTLLGISLSL